MIEQEYNDEIYYTYIYEDEGALKELFVKAGVDVNASAGKTILPVKSFSVKEIGEQAFSFTCVDDDGQKASCAVSVHSTSR